MMCSSADPARARLQPHRQQPRQDRQVADAVEEEAPSLTHRRHEHPRDRRPNDPGAVDQRRVQRDRVHQVGLADHIDQERLPRRDIERVDDPHQCRQGEDLPHLDLAGERQRGQHERQRHRSGLRGDDDPMPVPDVGQGTAERGQQEHGELARKTDKTEQDR
jgi:hypothetical protein